MELHSNQLLRDIGNSLKGLTTPTRWFGPKIPKHLKPLADTMASKENSLTTRGEALVQFAEEIESFFLEKIVAHALLPTTTQGLVEQTKMYFLDIANTRCALRAHFRETNTTLDFLHELDIKTEADIHNGDRRCGILNDTLYKTCVELDNLCRQHDVIGKNLQCIILSMPRGILSVPITSASVGIGASNDRMIDIARGLVREIKQCGEVETAAYLKDRRDSCIRTVDSVIPGFSEATNTLLQHLQRLNAGDHEEAQVLLNSIMVDASGNREEKIARMRALLEKLDK